MKAAINLFENANLAGARFASYQLGRRPPLRAYQITEMTAERTTEQKAA
ncbi:MAG: hypothetical protein IPL15_11845 [Comamonadaceae bacterium]|nr:hypothetical protein [Comamonadaceae bacterium]